MVRRLTGIRWGRTLGRPRWYAAAVGTAAGAMPASNTAVAETSRRIASIALASAVRLRQDGRSALRSRSLPRPHLLAARHGQRGNLQAPPLDPGLRTRQPRLSSWHGLEGEAPQAGFPRDFLVWLHAEGEQGDRGRYLDSLLDGNLVKELDQAAVSQHWRKHHLPAAQIEGDTATGCREHAYL